MLVKLYRKKDKRPSLQVRLDERPGVGEVLEVNGKRWKITAHREADDECQIKQDR